MTRDRVLEESVLAFTDSIYLQNTVKILAATEQILGPELVQNVINANNLLPLNFQNLLNFQTTTSESLQSLQESVTFTQGDSQPMSLKSVVEGTQTTLAALNTAVEAFAVQLAAIQALTGDITSIKTSVEAMDSRLTDAEALIADLSDEVKQARKEFANDPSKRLIDKIDSIDSQIVSMQLTTESLTKEIVDARSADRFDTLGERIGSLESDLEATQETLQTLQGKGSVTGFKVGRSILHGNVELIPGSNIAITRERNGFRIDVVDVGSVIDLGAPRIDPNNCCTGNSNPNFGN
jgi:cell division protein FtsL